MNETVVVTEGGETPVTLTPQHAETLERLKLLEVALLQKDPMMKDHLLNIHKNLIQYEELSNLLTDDQIGVIIGAQMAHSNTVLVGALKLQVVRSKH